MSVVVDLEFLDFLLLLFDGFLGFGEWRGFLASFKVLPMVEVDAVDSIEFLS
jgi:hypothetical protein